MLCGSKQLVGVAAVAMLVQDGKSTKQAISMTDTARAILNPLDDKNLEFHEGGMVSILISSDLKAELEGKSVEESCLHLGYRCLRRSDKEPIKQEYQQVWPQLAGPWRLPKVA